MIIDFHVHPLFELPPTNEPPRRPTKYGEVMDLASDPSVIPYAAYITSQLYNKRNPVTLSLEDFITEMDEAGINKIVLQNAASKGAPMRMINEGCAKLIQSFPDRFIGFAGYDPLTGEQAVKDIEYAIEELGFKGIKTVSSGYEINLNDEAYYPCYSKAQEYGLPSMIHTGHAIIKGLRGKYVHPLLIDDVAYDFPDLKIICAHLGGFQFMDVINMIVHHENVYADLSFWPLNSKFIDLVPWRVLEKAVPDKILLGSDYPFGQTPQEAVEIVKTLPVSQIFKEKMLGGNAKKLLGL